MNNLIKAKIFVLKDEKNGLINDIDTDQIFHNQYLSIVDVSKMGQYALDNLEGYKDFANVVEPGMLLVAGENFGSGSSRQQAVDCFRALKMEGVAAFSYGAIYKRNSINCGFPLLEIQNIEESALVTGTSLEFHLDKGEITDSNGKVLGSFKKFSDVQKEIIEKGGLLKCL